MVVATELREFLELAKQAAEHAGRLIRDGVDKVQQVEHKSAIDLVTTIDRQSEELIVGLIQERCPDHSIVAEEETAISHANAIYQWIIDPLDGTTNFVHRYPLFAVSIALAYRKEIVVGLVYAPMTGETFSATLGGGAYMNGEPIQTSEVCELDSALLATGFPYDRRERADEYLALFKRFMCVAQGMRRGGAAALDLCYVAAGRFDGFWEQKLRAWDVAAGSLIATEAGGRVTDFCGGPLNLWGDEIVCSNGRIHNEMVTITREWVSARIGR